MDANPDGFSILRRNQTPLPIGAGIAHKERRVLAIEVRFEGGDYPDRDLGDGRILHIGMGKRDQGKQKPTHGNAAMLRAEDDRQAFPVYQWLGENAYRFLGRYIVQSHDYGIIDEQYPDWLGFKFVLRPVWVPDAVDEAANGVDDDPDELAKDAKLGLPPERQQVVREIIKRNKKLAEDRKRATNYSCEVCQSHSDWTTAKGNPYVEAHHIIPLGDDGFDDESNLIIVCADCHRRLHYAANRDDELKALRVKRGLA